MEKPGSRSGSAASRRRHKSLPRGTRDGVAIRARTALSPFPQLPVTRSVSSVPHTPEMPALSARPRIAGSRSVAAQYAGLGGVLNPDSLTDPARRIRGGKRAFVRRVFFMSKIPPPETTVKRFAKTLMLAAVIALPLVSAGCVYVPPRAHY